MCDDKTRCCGCCFLESGIKWLGAWFIFEAIMALLGLAYRDPPQYFIDGVSFLSTGALAILFIMVMCSAENLKYRQWWLNMCLIDLVIHIILGIIAIAIIQMTDEVREMCIFRAKQFQWKIANDSQGTLTQEGFFPPSYQSIDECESKEKMNQVIGFLVVTVLIYIPIRLWFAINIRDWRDALRDKNEPKAQEGHLPPPGQPGMMQPGQPGMMPPGQYGQPQPYGQPVPYGQP